MVSDEHFRLRAALDLAEGSPAQVGALFEALVDRLGIADASAAWWAVFGASDASET